MKLVVRIHTILLIINFVQCTIDGISYLDELKSKDLFNNFPKRDNPCNPLYWYPRQIPDYCYAPKFLNPPNVKLEPKPTPPTPPMPPIPVPSGIIAPVIPSSMIPPPLIHSPIIPPPMASSPMIHSPIIPPPMVSSSIIHSPIIPPPMISSPMIPSPPVLSPMIPPSLSYSAPLVAPNPMVPMIPQNPYGGFQYSQLPLTYGQQTAGMVPGLPGIVSRDGGINILPFSDAYSDLLEKHKQKVIRKKLEKVLRRYEDYPRPRHLWRRKRFKKVFFDNE